ncbi:hypothetical protein SEA_PHRANN_29 [Mycobacterium phage Phrann]|uniref:RelA/SpoT domain-containing protein n=1 Tax=Mycobacterium phage Phrann TaxID=1821541 RepID=A0A142K822_9CAUD|nr:hypothetical protein BJD68_gp29 [Mycobacterium phage Phrann]AMS02255.1 hypothetical protein SEA_PHRANN_29 [Mycobacterium phage Phrann]
MENRPSSIINVAPAWSKGELKRLGEALFSGTATPEQHARYNEVMLWHNELAAEVAATLYTTDWQACPSELFDITARPKTIDTLIQKLQRERSMSLDEVQDLAGVRIDADIDLKVQTALAEEIATHFGERSRIRDMRENPHSGYRAVHVWLRLPAGRVEVQIRTVPQSEWANTYERLGDRYGRGIRYGASAEDDEARELVERMHKMSAALASSEESTVELAQLEDELHQLKERLAEMRPLARASGPINHRRVSKALDRTFRKAEETRTRLNQHRDSYLQMLREMRSMLDTDGS